MRKRACLGILILGMCCAACLEKGPAEAELALETQVAQQATQVAVAQPQEAPPGGATEEPTPTERPTMTPMAAEAPEATAETSGGEGLEGAPCELVAESAVTVYERPDPLAEVFGTMAAGFRVRVGARTADGWLGFDPAVAQAANVGVFRLRWVRQDSAVRLEGRCDSVEEVVGPPPGVCFTMPLDEVQVHAETDPASEVITTLSYGEYAAVVGRQGGWAQVDLGLGNSGMETIGWVLESTLNLNGPCEDILSPEP
jgi:hypothetical protein